MIASKASASFWECYNALPEEVRTLARKNFELWRDNPKHPSLHFKPIRAPHWSARVGNQYRAVGYFQNDSTFVWTWIGTHQDYNRF